MQILFVAGITLALMSHALAQAPNMQPPPDPVLMARAMDVLTNQRNTALDTVAIVQAKHGLLEAEIKKLRDELDALKKQKAAPEK